MAIFDQKNNSFSVLGFCWESENMVRARRVFVDYGLECLPITLSP